MFKKVLSLAFFGVFAVNFGVFAASNYKPVKGLEVKEVGVEEEGTREIIIRKREIRRNSSLNQFISEKDVCVTTAVCSYLSASFSNQIKTNISEESFGKIEKNGFAIPISDRRFGGDFFYGRKLRSNLHITFEVGLDYNFSQFRGDKQDQDFALHAISPSVRVLFDLFPESKFSVYSGIDAGFAIIDFVKGGDYDVKYSSKMGGLAGISYKFGSNNNFEGFFGYKFFYIPRQTFTFEDKNKQNEYETIFSAHSLNLGLRVKF